ncbi:MAG: hypothetical protein HY902_18215 [Deltaproteobacteria bacterium]|nr:hypothetical protein [Deltaproteobacteria bacterium]
MTATTRTATTAFRAPLVVLAVLALLAAACGKKSPPSEAPVPAKPTEAAGPAAAPGQAEPLAEAASPAAPPTPDFGVPYPDYVKARVLEKCAVAHFEDPIQAETHAIHQLLGQPFAVHLEHVFDPPKSAAKPAGKGPAKPEAKKAQLAPDTPEELAMRQKYRAAHALADAHTATQAAVQAELSECTYAPELGLIQADFVDRYAQAFVEIACLQRTMTSEGGQIDALAHAQAAAAVFAKAGFSAADFSRIGMVLGRFPKIQAKLHTAKAKSCPDPRIAEQAKASTGEWNGELKGDRNAALHLAGTTGAVNGAVQWLGATVRYADGAAETQAIPVSGSISTDKVSLFGQVGPDWVRLEGKLSGDRLEGTWTAQRAGTTAFKGTWKGEKVPSVAPTAAPAGAAK